MTDKQQIEMERDSLLDIHKRAVEKLDRLEGEVIAQKELVAALEHALLMGYGWLQPERS
jgi:hypothetical protein